MQPVPRIAVTPGEPAGIGPEIVLKLAQQTLAFEIVAVASKVLLESPCQATAYRRVCKHLQPGGYTSTP